MYIRHLLVRDWVNFEGSNLIKFQDGFADGIPNDLFVFVGENNSGKTSLFQLLRACVDRDYLLQEKDARENPRKEQIWETINLYGDKSEGIVLCDMISEDKERHIAGFYKRIHDKEESGVYFLVERTPAAAPDTTTTPPEAAKASDGTWNFYGSSLGKPGAPFMKKQFNLSSTSDNKNELDSLSQKILEIFQSTLENEKLRQIKPFCRKILKVCQSTLESDEQKQSNLFCQEIRKRCQSTLEKEERKQLQLFCQKISEVCQSTVKSEEREQLTSVCQEILKECQSTLESEELQLTLFCREILKVCQGTLESDEREQLKPFCWEILKVCQSTLESDERERLTPFCWEILKVCQSTLESEEEQQLQLFCQKISKVCQGTLESEKPHLTPFCREILKMCQSTLESEEEKQLQLFCQKISEMCKSTLERKEREQLDPLESMRSRMPLTLLTESEVKTNIDRFKEMGHREKSKALEILNSIGYSHYDIDTKKGTTFESMSVDDTVTGKRFDGSRIPEGHQYLFSVALHLAKERRDTDSPICLVIDEPMRCMHPALIQDLTYAIRDYCRKNKLQMIITSHSPTVVRAMRGSNIYRCFRTAEGKTTKVRYIYEGLPEDKGPKNKSAIANARLEELIFARIVLIVEGEGDRRLLTALISQALISEKFLKDLCGKHIKLDDLKSLLRGLTVVSAGSKDSIPEKIRLLETLDIPYCVVADADYFEGEDKSSPVSCHTMKQSRVRDLFGICDVLKDKYALDLLTSDKVAGKVRTSNEALIKQVKSLKLPTGCREIERGSRSPRDGLDGFLECRVLTRSVQKYAKEMENLYRVFTWCPDTLNMEGFVMPYLKSEKLAHLESCRKENDLKCNLDNGYSDAAVMEIVTEIIEQKGLKLDPGPGLGDFTTFLTERVLPYYKHYGHSKRLKIDKCSLNVEKENVELSGQLSLIEPDKDKK